MSSTSEAEASLVERPAPNGVAAQGASSHATSDLSEAGETSADRDLLHLVRTVGNVFTWHVDLATGELTCSPNVVEILGFPVGATLESATTLVHPEDRADLRRRFQHGIAGSQGFDAEFRLVHPETGDQIWVRSRGRRVSEDGAPDRFIGASQQVTDQKRRELHAAFLAELRRDLSAEEDAEAIPRAVVERIARYFDFALMTFTEVDANGAHTTVIHRHGAESDQITGWPPGMNDVPSGEDVVHTLERVMDLRSARGPVCEA